MGLNHGWRGPNIVRDGLVLYLDAGSPNSYPGSGTTWKDISKVNQNNGTLVNGPTFDSDGGGSIVFDGTNDRIAITPTTFNFNGGGAFEMWFKINQKDIAQGFFGGNGYPNTYPKFINFYMGTNNKLRWEVINEYPGTYTAIFSTFPFLTNEWYHTVGIFDTQGVKLYINGTLNTSANQSSNKPSSFNNNINIGTYSDSSLFGNCNISQFKIYNRALSSQEILQNYNATKSRFGL